MKKIFFFIVIIVLVFALSTCRKKTDIEALVYNYALAEPVAGAEVVLVERHISGWGKTSCEEIAKVTTDNNGECSFSKEKLRKSKNYDYYLAVTSAYGISQSYPCEGKASGFLNLGGTQTTTLEASSFDAFFKIQNNHLLNPSQPGDSLIFGMANPKYQVPGKSGPYGGGGVLGGYVYYGGNGYPFPDVMLSSVLKTNAGKNVLYIRKRKMGVVTNTIDTIKIYPKETKTIEINW